MISSKFRPWVVKDWEVQSSPMDGPCTLIKNYMRFQHHGISSLTIEEVLGNPASDEDLSFLKLKQVMEGLGFSVAALALSVEQLAVAPRPLIACLCEQKFVLVLEIEQDEVLYFCPEKGWRIVTLCAFSKLWNGMALLISSSTDIEEAGFRERQESYDKSLAAMPGRSKVVRLNNFLPADVCNAIVSHSTGTLEKSKVLQPDGSNYYDESRTSLTAFLDANACSGVETLFARAEALLPVGQSHFEHLQTTAYGPGQLFELHNDGFSQKTIAGQRELEAAGQRIFTIIVYLNDDYYGGETVFPSLKLHVKPVKGDAILFSSVEDSGELDQDTFHAGLPVLEGKKYINNLWVRDRPYKV